MRQIKFRAWQTNDGTIGTRMLYEVLKDNSLSQVKNWGCILMQFTGLHDKNGKEIYEGDILVFHAKVKGVGTIKHYWEVFFSAKGQWQARRGEDISRLFEKAENHEVIGNIYENPELLK